MIEINTNPSRSDLRWFGLLLGLFLTIVLLALVAETYVANRRN